MSRRPPLDNLKPHTRQRAFFVVSGAHSRALDLVVMLFGGEYPELLELDQEFRAIAPKHLSKEKAQPGDA